MLELLESLIAIDTDPFGIFGSATRMYLSSVAQSQSVYYTIVELLPMYVLTCMFSTKNELSVAGIKIE